MTEEKREYMSIKEVAEYTGIKRASLYYYIRALDIKPQKFRLDKQAYITSTDADRIKEVKDKPWLAGPQVKEEETKIS